MQAYMKRIIIAVILMVVLCSCPPLPPYEFLFVTNHSDRILSVRLGYNYPDTTVENNCKIGIYDVVFPYRTKVLESEYTIRQTFKRNAVLQVFVFKTSFSRGEEYDSLLARYEFTRDELNRCDWTIDYPSK